ncbi:16S rRNA (cytosine(1402)-N(4))-methyltransferase RsmH [Geitlerinema splendidum]|nr:16S rRNA (cytosine(1402)-N(4))-methyltransferase RsmH [Geitlerinema splendidum]
MTEMAHTPVMMEEVLSALPLRPGSVVVDGTLGLAGHASAMAKRIAPGGLLVALDWDESMLARAREILSELSDVDVRTYHSDYRGLPKCLADACTGSGRAVGADAILLDLGLNMAQIDDPKRGITFRTTGPLDMRMDRSNGEPASAVLNRLSAREIEQVLWEYGDERWARKIAQVIVDRRKVTPLETTEDLVDCVLAAVPAAKRDKRIHPATRTFQAVRIFVNQELEGLKEAVIEAARCLNVSGVIVVLSYHSGEDRAVKFAFKELAQSNSFELITKKTLAPAGSGSQG